MLNDDQYSGRQLEDGYPVIRPRFHVQLLEGLPDTVHHVPMSDVHNNLGLMLTGHGVICDPQSSSAVGGYQSSCYCIR